MQRTGRRAALAVACLLGGMTAIRAAEPPALTFAEAGGVIEVRDGALPVLRYSHGTTPVPEGTGVAYARGDYICTLHGLDGELLTDDYPEDHPHHRAVNWAWATIRWNGEDRDLFAVRGIWARPVGQPRVTTGTGGVAITADSVWKWDDETAVVGESVSITIHPQTAAGRAIDIGIYLEALVDDLSYGGRLEAGYSGFNIRMAPAKGQAIVVHGDPADAQPCRAWADYSAEFAGGARRSGLAILQFAGNPDYPQPWREYPNLNFFQPIYPGGTLVPLKPGEPVDLRYRLWIHRGRADPQALHAAWDDYHQHVRPEEEAPNPQP